jgi:hypothetical protein
MSKMEEDIPPKKMIQFEDGLLILSYLNNDDCAREPKNYVFLIITNGHKKFSL